MKVRWMKEGRREEERGGKDIRTDADGGERKILWEGGGGEILIWRGKRGRRVVKRVQALGRCDA